MRQRGDELLIQGEKSLTEVIQEGDLVNVEKPANIVGNTIETTAGGKGAWNKLLNETPLKANTTYKVKGTSFITDAEGNISKITADELFLKNGERNLYQQSIKCKKVKNGLISDDGGHYQGIQFDGIGEQINLAPMKSSINRAGGSYYIMETEWAKAIKDGGKVTNVEWEVIRGVDKRPIEINVTAKINGKTSRYRHNN